MFPDKLRLSSFPDSLPHYAWTAAESVLSDFVVADVHSRNMLVSKPYNVVLDVHAYIFRSRPYDVVTDVHRRYTSVSRTHGIVPGAH